MKTAVIALSIALLSASTAGAADLRLPPPPVAPPANDFVAGWYLRGDIGYLMTNDAAAQAYGATQISFDNERLGKSGLFGIGVGIRFNNWFRTDVTGSYSSGSKFYGTTSQSQYAVGYSPDRAKFTYGAALLNGYLDLGTWSGLTPYVGAGLGVSTVEVSNYRSQSFLFPGHPLYPVGAVVPYLFASGTIPGKTSTNFAWALMTGVTVDVGTGLQIDAGYRFLSLGKSMTFLDDFNVGAKFREIYANEFRMGLRYSFGANL